MNHHRSVQDLDLMWFCVTYLHQARVLVGREAVDVLVGLFALGEQETRETSLHVVCTRNLLLPVAHVDLHHLQQENQERELRDLDPY